MIVVDLPIHTISEANGRQHWGDKRKRVAKHRRDAFMACPRVDLPVVVRLVRIAPRLLDDDNLRSALKATRDGIADRLGVDDRDPLVRWDYAQERGKPKTYAVRIELHPGSRP